jgi:hypothetical protein
MDETGLGPAFGDELVFVVDGPETVVAAEMAPLFELVEGRDELGAGVGTLRAVGVGAVALPLLPALTRVLVGCVTAELVSVPPPADEGEVVAAGPPAPPATGGGSVGVGRTGVTTTVATTLPNSALEPAQPIAPSAVVHTATATNARTRCFRTLRARRLPDRATRFGTPSL